MINISPILAFDDNYIWLIEDGSSAVVVDPGDETPVFDTLKQKNLDLEAILITHKHYDHVGGIDRLKQRYPQVHVYGPAHEPIKHLDTLLSDNDIVPLFNGQFNLTILDVPGHTEGHIAYYTEGVLFCGDTLFAGGCGRVFSGTFEQLSNALVRLSKLPADTKVYCAHEYTEANLGFAKWVEPNNTALLERISQCQQLRQNNIPTVPSTIELENNTNPFMRLACKDVISQAEQYAEKRLIDHGAVFTALRTWKDKEYD